jgi:hypothetical protein
MGKQKFWNECKPLLFNLTRYFISPNLKLHKMETVWHKQFTTKYNPLETVLKWLFKIHSYERLYFMWIDLWTDGDKKDNR